MEKIDRLGWAAGFTFLSYGNRIGIRTNRPELMERMLDLIPPGWEPVRSPLVDRLYSVLLPHSNGKSSKIRRFNLVYGDLDQIARTPAVADALSLMECNLQIYTAAMAKNRIFVHAGVVGWRGKAIVIPGTSFSGKSTLVAELVRAGATYYSDEYAVFDRRGHVHPYARSLSIREKRTGKTDRFPVASLGGVAGVEPLPVGLVVASMYKPGAHWQPRNLSPGLGILELLSHALPARQRPRMAIDAIQRAVKRARVVKSPRGEAREVVDSILERNCS
jgi:hypothetical protein